MRTPKYDGQFLLDAPLPVPPWPTDPKDRAKLLRAALACEDGWRTAAERDTAYLRGTRAKGAGA